MFDFISTGLVPLASMAGITSVVIGIWLSLQEYQFKIKTETRLAQSEDVKSQIKLLKMFTVIMNIAYARGNSYFLEKLADLMVRPEKS
ncbi:hypothetical protein HW452_12695 [Halomonas aquamarina]|uniref:Uncharacterized protein n=1 Tax=Vreelandella aquamarina TaxID=77097 RepID=A0ACC5VXI2_9GAMM|nr:hypothetical protein [Halomonas aquamarina]MBZ5488382.1 hypothetical protein [Halomonas aquamarina]